MKGFDMAVITPEIKEFIKNNLGWITTVSKDGELDLGPKMSLFVLDDTHIAYHERTAGQTLREPQERFPAGHRFRQPREEAGLPLPRQRGAAR